MKKQLRNAGLLFTILLMQESSAFAVVKDRFIDEARLSAIFCEKNVTDAARASLTPTLHPKCLKAAAAKLQMPKSGEYRELVAHSDVMALLDAMIQYRLNQNQLPANYKYASVKGMQDVLEKVFIDNKSLKAGLMAWEANKETYKEMVFPSIHNLVVDMRTALDKLQEAVKSTDNVHHMDALMKEVRHHLDAAIHMFPYFIDSITEHANKIESDIKKAVISHPLNGAPLTADGPSLIQFENERKAAEIAFKDLDRARVLIESLSGRKEAIVKLHTALFALDHIAVKIEMKDHLKSQGVKRTADEAGMTDDNPAAHKKAHQDSMPASASAPIAGPPASVGGSASARRGGPSVVPPIGDDMSQPAKRNRAAPPPPSLDDATARAAAPAPAVRRSGPPAPPPPPPAMESDAGSRAGMPVGHLDAIRAGAALRKTPPNVPEKKALSGMDAAFEKIKENRYEPAAGSSSVDPIEKHVPKGMFGPLKVLFMDVKKTQLVVQEAIDNMNTPETLGDPKAFMGKLELAASKAKKQASLNDEKWEQKIPNKEVVEEALDAVFNATLKLAVRKAGKVQSLNLDVQKWEEVNTVLSQIEKQLGSPSTKEIKMADVEKLKNKRASISSQGPNLADALAQRRKAMSSQED